MIAVARAAHLLLILQVLRDLGTPVERELARAKLPTLIEEIPDGLVGLAFAFNFVARCARLEDVDDLGFLAAQRMQILDLSPDFLLASQTAPTIGERLRRFARYAPLEDSNLRAGLKNEGCDTRIFCSLDYSAAEIDIRPSEWLQVMALVEIIRSGAGPHWQPAEISFVSDFQPCDDVLEQFGNTRILVGQQKTSILVPTPLLAMPVHPLQLPAGIIESGHGPVSEHCKEIAGSGIFVRTLQQAIKPYLCDGSPPVSLAAEIAGTSVRSLQRSLKVQGVTYSDLLTQARIEAATDMLRDPGIKVIDVAMEVGYEDPSNFSRAFRRMTGMSPRAFRGAQDAAPLSL